MLSYAAIKGEKGHSLGGVINMKKIGIVKFLPEIAMMLTGGFITVSVLNPDFKIHSTS